MIHEIDRALLALIRRDVPGASGVEIVLDAPTREWAARRNAPTIDVWLYDLREDLRRRERGMINTYAGDGTVSARHLPPRHFKLSYLITAWTQRPEDEHRLLSGVLGCFLRHDQLPDDLLEGQPGEVGLPVVLTIGLPPPEDRGFADVWSALGGELRPSLDVVVTVPIDTGQLLPVGPPVSEGPVVRVQGPEGSSERAARPAAGGMRRRRRGAAG
jgi:hypothetical protein